MNTKNLRQQAEMEIDLIELLKYLLKKWKIFVIAGLVGAIAALGFNYYQVSNWKPQLLGDYVAKEFSEDDIRGFNMDAISQSIKYNSALKNYDEATEQRLALQLDPSDSYTYQATYLVEADNYTIDVAGAYYRDLLTTGDGKEKIKAAMNNGCTDADLGDLFKVNYYNLNKVITEDGSPTPATGQLTIACYAADEGPVKAVADAVADIINAGKQSCSFVSTIKLQNENIDSGAVGALKTLHVTVIEERKTYLDGITAVEKNMSKDEICYADFLRGENYQVNETAEMHLLKYPVIGAFILCCLFGMYFVCIFIFGKQIKTIGDVENMCVSRIVAQYPQNTAEYIASVIKAMDAESVLLSVDESVTGIEELLESLKKADSRVVVSGSLNSDPDAIAKGKDTDAIVLVAQLWKTEKNALHNSLVSADGLGKAVSGIVVVE